MTTAKISSKAERLLALAKQIAIVNDELQFLVDNEGADLADEEGLKNARQTLHDVFELVWSAAGGEVRFDPEGDNDDDEPKPAEEPKLSPEERRLQDRLIGAIDDFRDDHQNFTTAQVTRVVEKLLQGSRFHEEAEKEEAESVSPAVMDLGVWERHTVRHADGDEVIKPMPQGVVPGIARHGMLVQLTCSSTYGVIVDMTPGHAVIELEDGKRVLQTWGELAIEHVVPDPEEIGRPLKVLVSPAEPEKGDAAA